MFDESTQKFLLFKKESAISELLMHYSSGTLTEVKANSIARSLLDVINMEKEYNRFLSLEIEKQKTFKEKLRIAPE